MFSRSSMDLMEVEPRLTAFESEGYRYRKTSWVVSFFSFLAIRLGAFLVLGSLFFLPWSSTLQHGQHYPGRLFSALAYQMATEGTSLPEGLVKYIAPLLQRWPWLATEGKLATAIFSGTRLPWFATSIGCCLLGLVLTFVVKRRALVTPMGLLVLGVGFYGACVFITSGKAVFQLQMGFFLAVAGALILFAEVFSYRRTAKPHKTYYTQYPPTRAASTATKKPNTRSQPEPTLRVASAEPQQ